MNAPVLGAEASFGGEKSWSAALSWRYQKSDRHFSGSQENKVRKAEGSEVINRIHQLELAITRNFTKRWSLTVGIPYLSAVRSNALRDPTPGAVNQFGNAPVVARTETHAQGLGDITVVPRFWLRDPVKHANLNFALGFGVKIPTGNDAVQDTRQVVPTGATTFTTQNVVQTVDQSIQPGDGGIGAIVDVQGFYRFAKNKGAIYLTATYLINPAGQNGVATYRNAADEEIMSVPDQFLYRVGATWFPSKRVGLSLGMRWEGIPTEDLIGDSHGFRRPGYAFSVEPGFSYSRGADTFSLMVPVAVHRIRFKNVPDLEHPGTGPEPRQGDAAFADYVILAGWFHRFK